MTTPPTPPVAPLSGEEETQTRSELAEWDRLCHSEGIPLRDRKTIREEIARHEENLTDKMPRVFATLDESRAQHALVVAELAALKEAVRWIPVGERLPEKDGYYRTYHPDWGQEDSEFRNGLFGKCFLGEVQPAHWMPLPASPLPQTHRGRRGIVTTINVEQRHINEGKTCDSDRCAVAVAVAEHLEKRYGASVTVNEVAFFDFKKAAWLKPVLALPLDVIDWIAQFDGAPDKAQPFSFDLDIPQELLKSPNPAPAEGEKDVTD